MMTVFLYDTICVVTEKSREYHNRSKEFASYKLRSDIVLVLSRKKGETVMIGHDIELTVLDIQGDQVRLGIKAPRSIAVHRKEIYEEIIKENQCAASSKEINISEIQNIARDKIHKNSGKNKGNRITVQKNN